MKIASRLVAVVLAAFVFLCGCAQGDVSSVSSGGSEAQPDEALVGSIPVSFPLTETGDSLNIMITGYNGIDQETVYVWQQYEKMTGVNVNWTTVLRDKRAEEVHTALTNHRKLDLIMRCKLSGSKMSQYGENGLILNLAENDLLQKYAPNCWAYLQSHPDTLASVMNPDGSIYSLPQVNSGAELRVGLKLFVNRNWLENVNMQLPTTTGELRNLLMAFKQYDANGNGDPNDEIPLCSANWQSIQQAFYGAFGLANRGFHNLTVDSDPETGKVRMIAASDEYRDYLEYLNGLFSDGLLDNYIFTITDDQWTSNAANDLIGVFASTNLAWLPSDKADDWVAIDEALEGPGGDKMWTAIRANFHSVGAAVIPSTCEKPELVLKWLDYFWTDEGTLFYHMGNEGETFVRTDDGYDYAQAIYDKMKTENLSFDDVIGTYSPYPGGSNPTVEIAPYFMGGEMAPVPAAAARALFKYGPAEYWPDFTFTADEAERLSLLRTDISKYVSASCSEFVTGTRPLSEWDAYLTQLEKMNTAEMLKIYQAAADRYHALMTALG